VWIVIAGLAGLTWTLQVVSSVMKALLFSIDIFALR
jgi:hypothetical protein